MMHISWLQQSFALHLDSIALLKQGNQIIIISSYSICLEKTLNYVFITWIDWENMFANLFSWTSSSREKITSAQSFHCNYKSFVSRKLLSPTTCERFIVFPKFWKAPLMSRFEVVEMNLSISLQIWFSIYENDDKWNQLSYLWSYW